MGRQRSSALKAARPASVACHNPVVDFASELNTVRAFLAGGRFRVAVIGGVALGAYGNPRMTLDLDVATDAAAQDALITFMESQGFITLHRSPGYSNHRHASRGRVDFMYVRGHTADRLFGSTTELWSTSPTCCRWTEWTARKHAGTLFVPASRNDGMNSTRPR